MKMAQLNIYCRLLQTFHNYLLLPPVSVISSKTENSFKSLVIKEFVTKLLISKILIGFIWRDGREKEGRKGESVEEGRKVVKEVREEGQIGRERGRKPMKFD